MNIIVRLTLDNVIDLIENKDINNIFVLPISENFKDVCKKVVEEYTDIEGYPVLGISKCSDEYRLRNMWKDLSSMISIKEGDFVFEFDIPDDSVICIGFDCFLEVKTKTDINEIKYCLNYGEHSDDSFEVVLVPYISIDYCIAIYKVDCAWSMINGDLKGLTELSMNSVFFNEVGSS